jgi:hypothetical protein
MPGSLPTSSPSANYRIDTANRIDPTTPIQQAPRTDPGGTDRTVVVSRREARTMGADGDRDRERPAQGDADHDPEHQATDEEAGVPGVGHYRDRDRDRHLGGGADLGHVHEAIEEEAIDEES